MGAIAMLVVFLALLSRFLSTLLLARDLEGRYLVCCAFSVILYHVFINVGMVIGLVPTTGIPLPFLSYGVRRSSASRSSWASPQTCAPTGSCDERTVLAAGPAFLDRP